VLCPNFCRILPGSLLCFLILSLVLGSYPAAIAADKTPPPPPGLSLYPIPVGGNQLPVKCPVSIDTGVNSSEIKVGDIVRGTLKQSLLITPTYNAAPGSIIVGKVMGINEKRTLAKSIVSSDRRFSQDDSIDIVFTDLYCPDQRHFAIYGRLSKQKINIALPNGHVRAIAVNKDGQLIHDHEVLKLTQKGGNWVGQYALQVVTVTSGVVTGGAALIAVPLAMGVAGSISPSFVTNSPVDPDEKHPRLKGFGWGFVGAIPGSTIVEAFVCKGDDTEILPGLVMLVDFKPPASTAAYSVKAVVCSQPSPPATNVQIANAQTVQAPIQNAQATTQIAQTTIQTGTALKAQSPMWDTDTEALTWPEPNEQVASVGSIH
jgi:hypothetical protein